MAARIYTAGQLNQRVQFQARAAGTNGLREATGAWASQWGPVWAAVEPLTGRDFLAVGAMQNAVTTRFVIRYRGGVCGNPELRLVWLKTGEAFEIVSALPVDGGREWIEIMATHGVRNGRD